jgi:hypothetical protein
MLSRFLAIGWDLEHSEIKEADFFDGPSFASADALFIDPRATSDRWTYDVPPERDGVRRTYTERDHGFGRTLARLVAKRRAEAADLLYKAGGILVSRLRPRGEPLEVVSPEVPAERIDRYSFLPAVSLVDRHHQLTFPSNGRFLPRSGEDVLLQGTGSPFEEYLSEFDGMIVYQAVYQDLLGTPIERFATVLARNKVGDVVAIEIPFEEGRLVLLPPLEGVSPAREAEALVNAVSRAVLRPAFFPEPDWLPSYPLPGEDVLQDELRSLVDRHETLDAKIKELSSRLDGLTKYRRVLYTQGRFSLLPAVEASFRLLGFAVEESNYDLLLRSEEGDAIVAVAASPQAEIDLLPYRFLLGWVDEARTDGEGPGKGILVVSASRELDPKRRPTQFSPEVLRGCISQEFCLLTTYDLFKLVRSALEAKEEKARAPLRRAILDCVGEFRGRG